jgi:FKBP-type peptidyl-prolyl cis-trans isomerase FklB
MKFKNIIWCLLAVLALVSCKEEDDVVEEFANWQETNDAYFSNLVSEVQSGTHPTTLNKWEVFPCYTLPEIGYTPNYFDYVVVEKLTQGSGTTSPLQSDSVEVHYCGRLLPSRSYPQGFLFDKSYDGNFDPVTATPSKFSVIGVVKGFSTALMRMHRGDSWRVYIPYQLGYGSSARSSIPAYSTLVFDIKLEDFWRKTKGDRE